MTKIVLIVEDSMTEAANIQNKLKKAGYATLQTDNGDDAIAMSLTHLPDLILMDIVLATDTTGFEATEAITSNEKTKHIPVVVVTSKNEELDIMTAERKGASGYVNKANIDDELINVVNSKIG